MNRIHYPTQLLIVLIGLVGCRSNDASSQLPPIQAGVLELRNMNATLISYDFVISEAGARRCLWVDNKIKYEKPLVIDNDRLFAAMSELRSAESEQSEVAKPGGVELEIVLSDDAYHVFRGTREEIAAALTRKPAVRELMRKVSEGMPKAYRFDLGE